MNEDMEKKLDQLLADMPKREYDLDAWLAEDETAEFDRIVSEQRVPSGKTAESKRHPLWRWVAVAACFLLIVGVGLHYQFDKQETTSDVTLGKTANYQKQAPLPEVTPEPTPKPAPKVSKSQMPSGNTVAAPVRTPRTVNPLPTEKDSAPYGKTSASQDPNLHYASQSLTKDSVPYQDPARVDSFVTRLAAYHEVKEGELKCSATQDSNVVSAVYVFPDKKEVDVFGRMLQVACWYHDATPGYLLTFSHQQFFFELKDMHRQLHYRWIAERINGKILLYCTHAPLGTKVSSTCYQEYRDELMHIKSINTKTREI